MIRRRIGGRKPSIYEHIRAHLEESGLRQEGLSLPDEEDVAPASGLRFAPGAFERIMGSGLDEEDEAVAARLHAALVELADRPTRRARTRALATLRSAPPRAHVDILLEKLQTSPPEALDRLYAEVRKIALGSTQRDEVKYALAILGGFGQEEDADLFRTFARHDEFTLYAAVALANTVDDPIDEWLELCPHVQGWGRVELVGLLLREPRDDACAYLLRDGFRNDVMYGETALAVAQGCDLAAVLERESDPPLVGGARDLLSTLAEDAWGGPAGGMLDYDDGTRATLRFLDLFEPRELEDYLALDSLRAFVEDEQLDEEPAPGGWSSEVRERVGLRCRTLLENPIWREVILAELGREHDELPWQVVAVAGRLEIPLRDFLMSHIERHPADAGAWYFLVDGADVETMDAALALAMRLYDFDELAEGPAEELFRPEPVFQAAGWLLQELRRHPGRGWDVIRPALKSPVFRDRRGALWALSGWPRDLLTESQLELVREVASDDPSSEIRRDAERVLRAEPFEEDDDEDLVEEDWNDVD